MKKSKKKLMCTVLAMLMIASCSSVLSGCQSNSGTQTGTTSTASSQPSETSAPKDESSEPQSSADESSEVEESSEMQESTEPSKAESSEDNSEGSVTENPKAENSSVQTDVNSVEELNEVVQKYVEDTISPLTKEYEKIKADINTYDKYVQNVDKIVAFYADVNEKHKALCDRMRAYSLKYAEMIISSDSSNDDKYEELEELFDNVYDDGGDKIFDEIYDGILDDMFKDFYDGILDDAKDTASYKEWWDIRSNEYDNWSDTRSDVYDDWSDFRSDVYDFWSDLRSAVFDDNMEKANKKIEKFKKDING